MSAATLGSSPLTRGKPVPGGRLGAVGGLIPAHAGKTGHSVSLRASGRAHPRSRGENAARIRDYASQWGSSPLTRGKHAQG